MIVQRMNAPFWVARVVALCLTFAWSIVDVGLGLNAMVKANKLKNNFTQEIPPAIKPYITFIDRNLNIPIDVTVNDQDIVLTGAFVTAVSGLIAVLCTLMVIFHLRGPLSPLALRLQGAILALSGAWLFAVLVPFTLFYQSRSASIDVSVFLISIPQEIVRTVQNVLGLQNKYSQLDFLRLMSILPWFTVFFAVITAIMLFMAATGVYRMYRFKETTLEKQPAFKRKEVPSSPALSA